MSLRITQLITHLQPEDAYTLIESLEQLRNALMQTYGDDIRAMLQEAASQDRNEDEPF